MDVYHKVLLKLYQTVGGSESQPADLVDLVKKEGFLGNYQNIFKELNGRAWISETNKADWVRITHWGIKEAKNSLSGADDAEIIMRRQANRFLGDARDLARLGENFLGKMDENNFAEIESKLAQLHKTAEKIKTNF